MMNCQACGQEIEYGVRIYRNTVCPSCGKDLKICLNCMFYEPGVHWDCRESIDGEVRDKNRANFCEFFSPASGGARKGPASAAKDKQLHARNDFDKLFGS
jgi:hypothetical protein